ncbi:AAA family ATPase [Citromicrobium bathyomarinum]
MATQIEQPAADEQAWKETVDGQEAWAREVEKERQWLIAHKTELGCSWPAMASRLDAKIKHNTLSVWIGGKYQGPDDRFVEAIRRYRHSLTSRARIEVNLPTAPHFYETEVSKRLTAMLEWAKRGRIVYAALGAGLGKTRTGKRFQELNSNVFVIAVAPSCSGINSLQKEVLDAFGIKVQTGTSQILSRRIVDFIDGAPDCLLLFDEAQHLTPKAIEEIRSWHDKTGVGIALFGNEQVQQTLDGGARSAAFAQIFSRVAMSLTRSKPFDADIEAMLDGWSIEDDDVRKEVTRIAKLPGALRGATHVLEVAHMLALVDETALTLRHVQDAWAQLSKRREQP